MTDYVNYLRSSTSRGSQPPQSDIVTPFGLQEDAQDGATDTRRDASVSGSPSGEQSGVKRNCVLTINGVADGQTDSPDEDAPSTPRMPTTNGAKSDVKASARATASLNTDVEVATASASTDSAADLARQLFPPDDDDVMPSSSRFHKNSSPPLDKGRQLLADIATSTRGTIRNGEDKVALAVTMYDWVRGLLFLPGLFHCVPNCCLTSISG